MAALGFPTPEGANRQSSWSPKSETQVESGPVTEAEMRSPGEWKDYCGKVIHLHRPSRASTPGEIQHDSRGEAEKSREEKPSQKRRRVEKEELSGVE